MHSPAPCAGFLAVIQAIVSVMHDQGDDIRSVSVGGTRIVFLLRGHLYFLAVSSLGEPVAALRRQLELLYSQVLFLVTTGEWALRRVTLGDWPG